MRTIALLTDFGLEDNFVGVMKGVISGINPGARIIDISHNIKPQDIAGAAFLLRSSYKYFPEGTVHLVVVDPTVGSKRKAIIVKTKDYVFVGPDNGVLGLALKECRGIKKIINITNSRYFLKPVSSTFHGRDIFAPVAGYLSKGTPLGRFGRTIKKYEELDFPEAKADKDRLTGKIIYIDRFGNLVTNIERGAFYKFAGKNRFKIQFKWASFDRINSSYTQTERGSSLAIFGSFGNLEISINQGNAQDYFKARKGNMVRIIS